MKLRNKKTGELVERVDITIREVGVVFNNDETYTSLAELNEEWEDYEEPKEYWYIVCDGRVVKATTDEDDYNERHISGHKSIGNHFETEEEAERAVKKLKAWKRLKGKGFRFEGWDNTDRSTIHNFSLFVAIEDLDDINKDLDLLFGGEE